MFLQDGCGANDWRKELLEAVEKIVEQERLILSSAISSPVTPSTTLGRGGEGGGRDGTHDRYTGNSPSSAVNYQMLLDQVCSKCSQFPP